MCHSGEVCQTYTFGAIIRNVPFLPSLDNTEIRFVRESQYDIVPVPCARMVDDLIYAKFTSALATQLLYIRRAL